MALVDNLVSIEAKTQIWQILRVQTRTRKHIAYAQGLQRKEKMQRKNMTE
jgi:hypothetical protein